MKHLCHHAQCNTEVDPSKHMCPKHWIELPINLRNNLLKSYRTGQEIDKKPNREYIHAAIAIRRHINNTRPID